MTQAVTHQDIAEAGLQALLDALTSGKPNDDGTPGDDALDHAAAILDLVHEFDGKDVQESLSPDPDLLAAILEAVPPVPSGKPPMPSGAQPAGSGEYKEFTDTAGHKFATEHGKRVPLRGQQAAAGQQQAAQPAADPVAQRKTITDSIAANANLTPEKRQALLAKVKGMTDEQVGALHAKAEEMKKQKMAVQSVTKPSEQKPAIAPSRPPLDRKALPKELVDESDADVLSKDIDHYHEQLSTEQKDAVGHYTANGYEEINDNLRNGNPVDKFHRATVENLDSAIAAAPVLSKPITVSRGLALDKHTEQDFINKMVEAQKSGSAVTMPAYSSTTINKDTIAGFGKTQIKIKARHGLYVDPISSHQGEGEYILPRNSKIKITNVQHILGKGAGTWVIEAEQVLHGQ